MASVYDRHVDLPTFMEGVKKRNPGQDEFVQAVQEVAQDVFDFARNTVTEINDWQCMDNGHDDSPKELHPHLPRFLSLQEPRPEKGIS